MIFSNKLINFIAFQASWFVTCFNATTLPWLGVLMIGAWTTCLLANNSNWRADFKLMVAAGFIGYILDSSLVLIGIIDFPQTSLIGWPTTWWMVALWVNLAATLHYSLSWLLGRYYIGAILGAIAGPLAYYAGHQLGAIEIAGRPDALLLIGLEWCLAMPLLLRLAILFRKEDNKITQPVWLQ